MQGMILNQLTNHVREIILALRKEYVEVPDYIAQILDSYSRYQYGVAGHSVSIPAILNRGRARYYNGLDKAEDVEQNTLVERHFAHWKHLAIDVVAVGTQLKQTVGITTTQMVQQNYSLGHMNRENMYMLLNLLKSEYITAAAGLQGKKVTGLHGHYETLNENEAQRQPENLDDLFDENGSFHGIEPSALGEWDNDHTWGRRPLSNVGTDKERKYRHRPVTRDITKEQDGTTARTGDDIKPTIKNLEPLLRRYGMVVKGPKLGYMWDEGFSHLALDALDKNLNLPQLILGGAGYEYDMDCVKIAGTTIISDPNAKVGELRIMHVGNPGLEDGTVFPLYYDPLAQPADFIAKEAAMLSANRGRPKGMSFGRPREVPYQGTEWVRSTQHEDAIISRLLLDFIPVLCTLRGWQMKIFGLSVS